MNHKDLLTAVRSHLVALGHVRRASQATPAGKPPMWVMADDPGLPSPGDTLPAGMPPNDAELTVGIRIGGDVPGESIDAQLHRTTVDFIYRAASNKAARIFDLQELVHLAFHGGEGDGAYGRFDYRLDPAGLNIVVIHSQLYGFGPIGEGPKGGSEYVGKFAFQVRA